MKTRLAKLFFICLVLFLLFGCARSKVNNPFGGRLNDLRIKGYAKLEGWFNSIRPDSPEESFHEVIELKAVKVHIINRRKFFKWDKGSAYGSPVTGYATKKGNEIFIFGKKVKGKIIINEVILGHELNHLLNNENPKIVNPDKLTKMGL